MRWLVLRLLTLYRTVLSPLKGRPTCRFLPTCSEYAVEAIEKRGLVVGGVKALGRILRCNPLFPGGYDPVDRCDCHAEPAPLLTEGDH